MVKTTKVFILSLVMAFGLAGCSSRSSSQTSVSLSVKTDDGEKNYSMKAENNNGEVKNFQYVSDNEEDAFFTLEDGEVTYFVFDD